MRHTFYQQNIWGLLAFAVLMLFVYPKTGIDHHLIAPYYDVATQSFLLKHHLFLENFMHTGLKYCMILIAICTLLLGLAGNRIAPLRASITPYKKPLLWTFVAMLLSTSAVSTLKSFSMHGCPSDLITYGGNLPLLGLFEHIPQGIQAGHCFPGGHASGGFALMAFFFAFRGYKPNFAMAMLALALVLGFSMGWAQMMRGEHFLSHNLWSAWVVWLVCLVCRLFQTLTFPQIVLFTKQLNIKKPTLKNQY